MAIKEKINKDSKQFEEDERQYLQWLTLVVEKNDQYFETIQNLANDYINFVGSSTHKITLNSLFSFHVHLSTIKNAIIDLSETNNIYSIKALYRIYLEHWLKGTYIWTRYIKEQNDNVGQEYNSVGSIGEALKYGNSVKHVSLLIDAEEKNLDVWDRMCTFDPGLREINKKNITQNIKKFEYKSIAKYLLENGAPGGEWVPMIIPEYSELSSYVHGGPGSSHEYGAILYDKQFEEYRGMIKFAFNTCRAFAYSMFALMYKDATEDEKKKMLPLLHDLMDKKGLI
jgi:hypothetical protein